MNNYHLAQLNVAQLKFDSFLDAEMAGFTSRIEDMNDLADQSPGFVWRLPQVADEDAIASMATLEGPPTFMNLSVWEDVAALKAFTYRTAHSEMVKQRSNWMLEPEGHYLVLWWIPVGKLPTLEEGQHRLGLLQAQGASPEAFTFRTHFPYPAD